MAWNRASEKKVETEKRGQRRNGLLKGLAAGAIVAVGAWIAAWVLWPDMPTPVAEDGDGTVRRIREAKPTAVEAAVETNAAPRETRREIKNPKFAETYRDAKGVLRYKVGNGRVPPSDEEMAARAVKLKDYSSIPKFKHRSETEIATLATLKLGSYLHGSVRYDERFMRDFKESLDDPTPILETDSEKDRKIKETVAELKKSLVERMSAGEKLEDILTAERKEIARMADYKRVLQDEFRRMMKDGEPTMDDVDDYFKAANGMLKSKGIEPLKYTPIMRKRIELELQRKKGVRK